MTWLKVINCVNTELFPVLAITLKKCIDEKLFEDSEFKVVDFGSNVVEDVMKRLKAKRTMNSKEIEYLMELFQRAVDSPKEEISSVHNFCQTLRYEKSLTFRYSSVCTQRQLEQVPHSKSARISVQSGRD